MNYFSSSLYHWQYPETDTLPRSWLDLVLLGNNRHGISTLQCLPTSIPPKRRQKRRSDTNKHRLPELCHHIHCRSARLDHCLLHSRYEVHWTQRHDRYFDLAYRDHSFLVHPQLEFELSAYDELIGSFLPEHHVWCAVCLVCSPMLH